MEEISMAFCSRGRGGAAQAMIEAVRAPLPGVLGSAESLDEESFETGCWSNLTLLY